MFKDFQISILFDWQNGNTDLKKEHINGKGYPVVSSGVENTGIIGCTDVDARILPAHTITVDMFGNVYYRDFEYKEVTHARVFTLIPKGFELDVQTGLYFVSSLKMLSKIYSYNNMCSYAKISNMTVALPVIENSNPDHEYTVDDIDWQYMYDRITELERERITELDAYLQVTGLNDYELTEDDKEILSLFAKRASDENGTLEDIGEDEVRFGEFVLGGDDGLFNIYSPKKRFNANTITFGGKYPYVARGSSNNGIRGYITEDEKYLSPAKSLSFGQDTATVYYQPDAYFTGDKIKVMVLNNRELTPELAEYFITAIARAFSTFAWGQSSFNENIIKSMKIELPIKSDGTPDFDYMERYIRAMEKVVIADVVKYKDKVIETTKKVVGD